MNTEYELTIDTLKRPLSSLGEFTVFIRDTIISLKHIRRRRGIFIRQCEIIGSSSIWIVAVAACFLGAVLGYQLYISLHLFGAEALLGGSVGISLFRELAPVMTGIMVTGRAGAAMAAEIASMRISEQIDALEIMSVNPIEYLVAPRVLAGLIMVPLLSVVFAITASMAAAMIACGVMGLDSAIYWSQFAKLVDNMELIHCTTKGAFFGLFLTLLGCFFGYRAYGGAKAVGLATRSTVVVSCLVILFSDYILTAMLPFGFAVLRAR